MTVRADSWKAKHKNNRLPKQTDGKSEQTDGQPEKADGLLEQIDRRLQHADRWPELAEN